jgi:hypothetical protein
MKIKANDITATTIKGIIAELENNTELIDYMQASAYSRRGDSIEAMACAIVQDIDIDVDDFNF